MAGNVAALLDLVCGRLDSDAEAFWNNREIKELHINLREVYNLLVKVKQNVNLNSFLLTDLKDMASDVDGLIDEHPELSISSFDKKVRRIHGRSVQLLNSLRDDESSARALSQATSSSSRSDETMLERCINSVKQFLLQIGNMVRFIHIVGVSGTDKTGIAHRVYTNDNVESHFPFRFWFSIGENLDLSTVIKTITIQCWEIPSSERLLIVLNDVCDLNDVQLANLRLLISEMRLARFCVLVTTRSDRVATMMGSLPAEHLTYFSDSNSWSNYNCELSHVTRGSQTLESESAMGGEWQAHCAKSLDQ